MMSRVALVVGLSGFSELSVGGGVESRGDEKHAGGGWCRRV